MDLNRQWPRNARQVTAAPAQAAVRCSPPIYLIAARTAVRAAGGVLAAAASARGLKRRADGRDAEDRNLRRDLLEFTQRGMAIDRDVGPGSRCQVQVPAQDRRPGSRRDLLEANDLAAAMAQHRPPVGGPDVVHPA